MKRRRPFEILVWLRSIEERRRRADVSNAQNVYQEAMARLEELKEKYRSERPAEESLTAAQLRSLQLRGLASNELLETAAAGVDQSRQRLDDGVDSWRKAAADLDAAERLELREKHEAARNARIAAERSLNDLQQVLRNEAKEDSQ